MARAIVAVVAVVAVVALAVGAIWLVSPKHQDSDGEHAVAWEAKAKVAFQPLVDDVPDLVRGARDWQSGEQGADTFRETVAKARADFVRARERLSALKPS